MAGLLELARLAGLAALLLSFAILAGRRIQPVACAAQTAAVGVAALCQAEWGSAAMAVILVGQAIALWLNRPALPDRPGFPVVTLCGALLLVVLATASTLSDGMAVPLAIVLLGLLGAASMPGPYGVVSLLNGVVLAMVVAPGLPLRPAMTVALAALALVVVRDGSRLAWVRR